MHWVCPEDVCGPVQSQGGGVSTGTQTPALSVPVSEIGDISWDRHSAHTMTIVIHINDSPYRADLHKLWRHWAIAGSSTVALQEEWNDGVSARCPVVAG
jgi:hypothetical protein